MTSNVAPPRFGEHQRERLTKLLRLVGSVHEHESTAARAAISRLLQQFTKTWSDLVELLGGSQASIHPDLVRNLTGLGSDDCAGARIRLDEWRAWHHKSWNDLVDQLYSLTPEPWVAISPGDMDSEPDPDLLSLLIGTLKEYVELKPCEYITVALWALHTHCYRDFMVTPRLVLRSPTPGCGKTVLMDILERLTARGIKYDSLTAAALLRLIDATRPTLMLDESDNLGIALQQNGTLKAILNAGHRAGGTRAIVVDGEVRRFEVFTPVALALPDTSGGLTRTLDSRAITINMERAQHELKRFDINHSDGTLDRVYGQILIWRRAAKLDPDPRMPAGTLNRTADNWRVLLSVADSLGHGKLARETMCEMAKLHRDADCKVELLSDIRTLFSDRLSDRSRNEADRSRPVDLYAADRFPSKFLLDALHALDDSDWTEFCGVRGDEAPHRLRPSEMTSMLGAFGIRTRTIWPPEERTAETKSVKGYQREQFEVTWNKYCGTPAQAAQGNNVRDLRRAGIGTV
jgi:hypothetical protein